MKMSLIKKVLLVASLVTCFASCKKMLDDVKPGTELDATQMYRDVYDANAAVMGIYGKFMGLADRYIVLNELRADLMEYTQNADENLRQLSTHTVRADNPWATPRPFYQLILQCNDVLKNFQIMLNDKKLTTEQFNQRYSDIGALRSFLYLQLGIHYGTIPYITDPLENINDINNLSYPTLKLEDGSLMDTLINFTENLPFKEVYPPNVGTGVGTSLNITLDGYPTDRFFINKKCLLGDLYLWKGNYTKAATYYRDVMETASNNGSTGENFYSQYRLGWSGNANLYVSYARAGDVNSLLYSDGWGSMFSASDEHFTREMIWALPYDSKFKPDNPLIKLFSPIGGNYLVQPSQEIIDNWNNQTQGEMRVSSSLAVGTSGVPFDARWLLSTKTIGGQPVITKFISNYISTVTGFPINVLAKNGRWFVNRQAQLHLRFAEAANRDGYPRLAYALFNNGIPTVFDVPGVTDKTNIMNTFAYPDPYKFDARNGTIPNYRSPWYRNIGVRSRAGLLNYPLTATNVQDSILQIEIGILNEDALELAFEGTRWADLLRISLRRNDPSIIANKVYDKLRKSNLSAGYASQARDKLMRKDWYLPFKL